MASSNGDGAVGRHGQLRCLSANKTDRFQRKDCTAIELALTRHAAAEQIYRSVIARGSRITAVPLRQREI